MHLVSQKRMHWKVHESFILCLCETYETYICSFTAIFINELTKYNIMLYYIYIIYFFSGCSVFIFAGHGASKSRSRECFHQGKSSIYLKLIFFVPISNKTFRLINSMDFRGASKKQNCFASSLPFAANNAFYIYIYIFSANWFA